MKKRFLCAFLALVMLAGMMAMAPFEAEAASNMTASQEVIELIKKFEGFVEKPYWDNKQWTVGYGTYCTEEEAIYYMEHGITKEEAEEKLKNFVDSFSASVNSFMDTYGVTMTQQQFDAMVSLSYNCGTGWIRESKGNLHNALKSGATGNELLYAFSLWSYTNNTPHNGLIKRRLAEANLYLNGVYSTSKPSNYTYVLFNANGGSVDYLVQGYDTEVDTPIRVVVQNTYFVTSNGETTTYTFDGWYTAKSGGTKVEVLDGSLGEGTTLYAHWKTSDGTVVAPSEPDTTPVDGIQVTVTGDRVNVRQGPGTNYAAVGSVTQGEILTITETASGSGYLWGKFGENKWVALSYTNYDKVISGDTGTGGNEGGNSGNEGDTGTQQPETTVTGTVTVGDSLNIRSGPGTGYSTVGKYTNGTKVTILEQQTVDGTVWGRTDLGWISLDYVKLDGEDSGTATEPTTPPATDPPVTEPPVTEPPATEPAFEPWEGTVKVSDLLNIRSSASTYGSIVGYLSNGAKVTILEETTVDGVKWGRIEKGWICLKYVTTGTVTEPEVDTPVVDIPNTTEPSETQPNDSTAVTGNWTGIVSVKDMLYIRSEAGLSGKIVGNLVNGSTVTITQQKTVDGKVWGRVEKGWICLDYVIMEGETAPNTQPNTNEGGISEGASTVFDSPKTMMVNTCSLRIRGGAGVTNSILGYVSLGDEVEVYETKTIGSTIWGRTDSGWVSLKYLK